MTRVPGIGVAAPLLALAIPSRSGWSSSAPRSLARQEDDLAPVEIGAGPVREQALGFTGRNVYSRESVELFGYLTAVIGLERGLLFTDAGAAPSPQIARFTYAGSVSIASRPIAPTSPRSRRRHPAHLSKTMPPAHPGTIPGRLPPASRSPSMRSTSSTRCSGRRLGSASSSATGS